MVDYHIIQKENTPVWKKDSEAVGWKRVSRWMSASKAVSEGKDRGGAISTVWHRDLSQCQTGWVREGLCADAEGTAFRKDTADCSVYTGDRELGVGGGQSPVHQGTGLGIASGRTSRNGAFSWQLGNSKQRAVCTAFQGQPAAGAVAMGKHVPSCICREHTTLGSVNKYPYNLRAGEASNAPVRCWGITMDKGDPLEFTVVIYLLWCIYSVWCTESQRSTVHLTNFPPKDWMGHFNTEILHSLYFELTSKHFLRKGNWEAKQKPVEKADPQCKQKFLAHFLLLLLYFRENPMQTRGQVLMEYGKLGVFRGLVL